MDHSWQPCVILIFISEEAPISASSIFTLKMKTISQEQYLQFRTNSLTTVPVP